MLDQFVSECLLRSQRSESLFGQFEHHYSIVRNHAKTYGDNENAIKNLIEKLKGLEDIGHMQVDLSRLEQHLYTLRSEREGLIREVGSKETDRQRLETERSGFALKSKANRKIETHKAYAQAMYDILKSKYTHRENEIRKELSEKVDTIFRRIYKGGLSLTLDENYNIVLNVIDCDGWCSDKEIDTSTGQGYAVILGFIGGVIEMARKNRESDELAAEAYPLVMDAPLSAFDKIRIQTVCDELPRVAEQVVIFIKDTDGELAEQHLCARVGKRYTVEKKNELESVLREGKHNG
jgi:DNA sulfur modification protein DndD